MRTGRSYLVTTTPRGECEAVVTPMASMSTCSGRYSQPVPRPLDQARRAALLTGVIAYIAERGLTELSLRPLADYLGTSSRMLIHYFGSKEQMLVAALETQRPDIAGLFSDV